MVDSACQQETRGTEVVQQLSTTQNSIAFVNNSAQTLCTLGASSVTSQRYSATFGFACDSSVLCPFSRPAHPAKLKLDVLLLAGKLSEHGFASGARIFPLLILRKTRAEVKIKIKIGRFPSTGTVYLARRNILSRSHPGPGSRSLVVVF